MSEEKILAVQIINGKWYHLNTLTPGTHRKIVEFREEPYGVRIIRKGGKTGTIYPHREISKIKRG